MVQYTKDSLAKTLQDTHNAEKNGTEHIKASIKPYILYDLDDYEKTLDAFARLLTGMEVCAAVHYNGQSLYIASKEKVPYYAKDYIKVLKDYIITPFKDNYNKLLKISLEPIITELNRSSKIDEAALEVSQSKNKLHIEFLNSVQSLDLESSDISDIDNIVSLSIKLYNELSASSYHERDLYNLVLEIVRPISDVNKLTLMFENAIPEFQGIITAIKDDQVNYVSAEFGKHGEMKISESIHGYFQNFPQNIYNYIGIAKLACCPCEISLNIFGQSIKPIRFSGSHGGTYRGWQAPSWLHTSSKFYDEFHQSITKTPGSFPKEKELHPAALSLIFTSPLLASHKSLNDILNIVDSKPKIDLEIKELKENLEGLKKQQAWFKNDKNKISNELQNAEKSKQELEKKRIEALQIKNKSSNEKKENIQAILRNENTNPTEKLESFRKEASTAERRKTAEELRKRKDDNSKIEFLKSRYLKPTENKKNDTLKEEISKLEEKTKNTDNLKDQQEGLKAKIIQLELEISNIEKQNQKCLQQLKFIDKISKALSNTKQTVTHEALDLVSNNLEEPKIEILLPANLKLNIHNDNASKSISSGKDEKMIGEDFDEVYNSKIDFQTTDEVLMEAIKVRSLIGQDTDKNMAD